MALDLAVHDRWAIPRELLIGESPAGLLSSARDALWPRGLQSDTSARLSLRSSTAAGEARKAKDFEEI